MTSQYLVLTTSDKQFLRDCGILVDQEVRCANPACEVLLLVPGGHNLKDYKCHRCNTPLVKQ
jgi:hypothetical protein